MSFWLHAKGAAKAAPRVASRGIIVEERASDQPPPPTFALKANEERLPVGTRKAIFPTDDGDVALIYPDGITASSLEDLGDYLDIFLKKQKAKVEKGGDGKG